MDLAVVAVAVVVMFLVVMRMDVVEVLERTVQQEQRVQAMPLIHVH